MKRFLVLLAVMLLGLSASADAPRLQFNIGFNTVTDVKTGVMWLQGTVENLTWEEAQTHCANNVHEFSNDWRLPTIKELQSIVDRTRKDPAIDPSVFPDTPRDFFWTSTTCGAANCAWAISFSDGLTVPSLTGDSVRHSVRCVRPGI